MAVAPLSVARWGWNPHSVERRPCRVQNGRETEIVYVYEKVYRAGASNHGSAPHGEGSDSPCDVDGCGCDPRLAL